VMEKCTFCVQRINAAKDVARRENRTVKDGEFTVACAQACPSNAIVFGNLREEGEVRKLRKAPRAFVILDHLYTRPAISYLKSIRRVEEA
jgi:Fe-S-cluster-containing dehydrogenase component